MSASIALKSSDSRFASYGALIALAWTDLSLHEEEKKLLHSLIDNAAQFSDYQRLELHNMVESPLAMHSVWPRVTEASDRAYVLDMALPMFHADGEYCENEKATYEQLLQDHLTSLDSTSAHQDLAFTAESQEMYNKWFRNYAQERAMRYKWLFFLP